VLVCPEAGQGCCPSPPPNHPFGFASVVGGGGGAAADNLLPGLLFIELLLAAALIGVVPFIQSTRVLAKLGSAGQCDTWLLAECFLIYLAQFSGSWVIAYKVARRMPESFQMDSDMDRSMNRPNHEYHVLIGCTCHVQSKKPDGK